MSLISKVLIVPFSSAQSLLTRVCLKPAWSQFSSQNLCCIGSHQFHLRVAQDLIHRLKKFFTSAPSSLYSGSLGVASPTLPLVQREVLFPWPQSTGLLPSLCSCCSGEKGRRGNSADIRLGQVRMADSHTQSPQPQVGRRWGRPSPVQARNDPRGSDHSCHSHRAQRGGR